MAVTMPLAITPDDIKAAAASLGLGTPSATQKIQLAQLLLQARNSDAYVAAANAQARLHQMQRLQAMAATGSIATNIWGNGKAPPVYVELQPFLNTPDGGWPVAPPTA